MEDNTAVMLSIDSGKVITLNEIATSIVEFVTKDDGSSSVSTNKLIEYLLSQYEVDAELLTKDIKNFISVLNANS